MANQDAGTEPLVVFTSDMMDPLFTVFERTKGVIQMEEHHPEGDVFTHSLQVLQWAFRETVDTDLILAAMLHDVGKALDSKGHDKIGAELLKPFVSVKTQWLIEQHMRFWCLVLGEMRKLSKVKDLAGHPWIPELLLLARWDKLGRDPRKQTKYDRCYIMDRLNRCAALHFRSKEGGSK